MKVYGSRHPMSNRTGDIGVAKIGKGRKTSRVSQLWGQRDEDEGRHLEPGGIWDYTVYGICSLNIFTTEY